MKLSDLAKKAAALPGDVAFDWPGAEHWHDAVFRDRITTLPEAVAYIDELRKRMADYSCALANLAKAYKQMRDLMLAAEIDP